MAEVATVRIHLPHASGEWATINASDFDPAKHVLFDERPALIEPLLVAAFGAEAMARFPGTPIQDDVSHETPPIVVWDPTLTKFTETPAPRKRGRPRKTEA